ncbi:hypothetical protein GH714_044117 [Hevea brasiliensis]|uniref:Uncharacterized protein n=1 Tax=Hevea brasiliensis TaxID=3981 RepID=A0A6A6K0X3_HEVBR|nr:hypothetical protein GH714_044117 [Hevea brasiliensis]
MFVTTLMEYALSQVAFSHQQMDTGFSMVSMLMIMNRGYRQQCKISYQKYEEAVFDTETGIVDFNDAFGIKAVDSIGFNAGYLASIEKAAKLFNNRLERVKIQFSGASSSAVCELKAPTGEVGK